MINKPLLRIPLPQLNPEKESPKETSKKTYFLTQSQTLANSSQAKFMGGYNLF